MRTSTSCCPRVSASATGTGVVSHGGAALLLRTVEKTGLATALSDSLASWRKPLATHDPGKIILDLAVTLALGGDCLTDMARLRAHLGHLPRWPRVHPRWPTAPQDPHVRSAVGIADARDPLYVAPGSFSALIKM
ncbi:hypothetical protein M2280_001012 [Prescottella agglutinans]|uniref:Transposase DDE domain-containing protein n=1 Tax=Prescottella agglutinans TaxID=1644129 RepID=A0ABT6M690_9NOCA|nr:hypothetical protein [Prescottella agglutinans]